MTSTRPSISKATDRPLSVGVFSLAHVHAATYVSLLKDRPDVQLVVADPLSTAAKSDDDGPRGKLLAEELGVAYVDTYEELVAQSLDAAIICSETATHRTVIDHVAPTGIPILCEKPLATNLADANHIIDVCQRPGSFLMTAYPVRFHPAFRTIVDTVRSGKLGRILSASGVNTGQAPIDSRAWFVDAERSGGGALIDHTVHLADLMDELLGTRVEHVYAQVNRIINGNRSSVETGGLVAATYEDDVVATIDCSWSAPASYPSWGGLSLTIECEKGSVTFDAFSQRMDHYDDEAGRLRWIDFGVNLDALMLDHFISTTRNQTQPQPDGHSGLRTLELVVAAYKSAETNQTVALDRAN